MTRIRPVPRLPAASGPKVIAGTGARDLLFYPRPGRAGSFATRFARYFKNSPTFWMNLQTHYDLEVAEDEIAYKKVERDVRPLEAASSS